MTSLEDTYKYYGCMNLEEAIGYTLILIWVAVQPIIIILLILAMLKQG